MSGYFYVSAYSIGVALDAMVFVLIVLYLRSIQNPKRSTSYLALALSGVNAAFLMLSVIFMSVDPLVSQIAWILLHLAIFGIHGFLMFGYELLLNVHQKESEIVKKISLAASFFGFFYYAIAAFFVKPTYIFDGELYYYDIAVPGIIIGVQLGWMFVVLFRKAAFFSDSSAKGFWRVLRCAVVGKDPKSQTVRRFMLGFMWVLPFEFFILFATVGWVSWVIAAYMTALGVLALTTWLVLFYFKHSGEANTFLVKQVGLFLLTTMTIIGIIGVITVEEQKGVYHDLRYKESLSFLHSGFSKPPQNLSALYKLEGEPKEIFLQEGLLFDKADIKSAASKGGIVFLGTTDKRAEGFVVGYLIDSHLFLYPYEGYRAWIAQTAHKVLIALAMAVVLAIFLFPPILRRTILAPLGKLLEGVDRVNRGEFDTRVDIDSNDEIGYLTESFNKMVVAIREGRDKLQEYADNLEGLVEERTVQLRDAKEQTDRILQSVEEGLFLLFNVSGKFVFGSEYSQALTRMLGIQNLSNTDFLTALGGSLGDGQRADIEKFLRLMFKPSVSEEMLRGLNPLDRFSLFVDGRQRHLRFEFLRIQKEGVVVQLMGRVSDETEEIRLAKELEMSQKREREQTRAVLKILNCDPLLLFDFLLGCERDILDIDNLLHDIRMTPPQKVDGIYRSIHSIKGNASMLELDFISISAHEIEDELSLLRKKRDVGGADFTTIVPKIEKLKDEIEDTRELLDRISLFAQSTSVPQNINKSMLRAFENLLSQTAHSLGKKVRLEAGEFDLSGFSKTTRLLLKDSIVQILRNSVAHGIETPDERLRAHKDEEGKISISAVTAGDAVTISIEDDGAGIDLGRVVQKALTIGVVDKDRASRMSEEEKLDIIFMSGFSTSESVNLSSGRGVGMDIVRSKLQEIGADIKVSTEVGRGTLFKIVLRGGSYEQ